MIAACNNIIHSKLEHVSCRTLRVSYLHNSQTMGRPPWHIVNSFIDDLPIFQRPMSGDSLAAYDAHLEKKVQLATLCPVFGTLENKKKFPKRFFTTCSRTLEGSKVDVYGHLEPF